MRPFLALGVDAGAFVLHKRRGLAQTAVAENWEHRQASAAVVGDQDELSSLIHGEVARTRPAGRHFVQESELTSPWSNGKGADSAATVALVLRYLVDGVKVLAARVYG